MTVLEVLDVGMTSPLNRREERSTPILVEGFFLRNGFLYKITDSIPGKKII